MTISTPCYATREDVKYALDVKSTARNNQQVDRAIQGASRSVDGMMHRVFYPTIATKYVDWPNFQNAFPWRIWLDKAELADVTVNVPVLTSGGNVIPNADVFWGSPRYAPPFTYFELNRASNASFGQGNTPQRDVSITGTFGYSIDTTPGGIITVAMSDTTGTLMTVSNGSLIGVGDGLLVDTERFLVTDRANVATTQSQQGSGCSTSSLNDNILAVADGTKFFLNEVVTLDAERMLILDVTGNNITVKRAWDGTILSTHSGATVYASRLLTVTRGSLGTTATTHLINTAVSVHLVPSLIRQLTVAEAVAEMTQESAAYASSQGSGSGSQKMIGSSLPDLRAQTYATYGRKARTRVV